MHLAVLYSHTHQRTPHNRKAFFIEPEAGMQQRSTTFPSYSSDLLSFH